MPSLNEVQTHRGKTKPCFLNKGRRPCLDGCAGANRCQRELFSVGNRCRTLRRDQPSFEISSLNDETRVLENGNNGSKQNFLRSLKVLCLHLLQRKWIKL